MVKKEKHVKVVPSDPEKWSDKSKQSISYQFNFVKEYRDIDYNCWRCEKPSVFTAVEQKYTYEVKKAYIDQKRILCSECWEQSNEIAAGIKACEEKWAISKNELKNKTEFLSEWLCLLNQRDEYVPYKSNIAIKNMLQKLLQQHDKTYPKD
jgi:hypothetical protein